MGGREGAGRRHDKVKGVNKGDEVSVDSLSELLRSEKVAALLHISARALHDYDRRAWLHPVRVGRRKLYRAAEVFELVLRGTPRNLRDIRK